MVKIKELNIEYISSALLAVIALFLSFSIGFLSGNSYSVVFYRVVAFVIVFGILGYVNMYIIKRYVPEVYEKLNSLKSIENDEVPDLSLEQGGDSGGQSLDEIDSLPDDPRNSDLAGAEKTDESLNLDDSEPSSNVEQKKDERVRFEPKIMAQAVRSMMNKNED